MNDMQTTERTLRSFQAVTDYLLTGKAPAGVRPEVMDALASLIALWPKEKPRHGALMQGMSCLSVCGAAETNVRAVASLPGFPRLADEILA